MKVHKIIIVAALAIFTMGIGNAQAETSKKLEKTERKEKSTAERVKHQTEKLAKKLELTPEQSAKVEAINLKYAESEKVEKEKRQDKRDQQQAEIRSVLTEYQAGKFDAHTENRKMKGKHKRDKKGEKRKARKERKLDGDIEEGDNR